VISASHPSVRATPKRYDSCKVRPNYFDCKRIWIYLPSV